MQKINKSISRYWFLLNAKAIQNICWCMAWRASATAAKIFIKKKRLHSTISWPHQHLNCRVADNLSPAINTGIHQSIDIKGSMIKDAEQPFKGSGIHWYKANNWSTLDHAHVSISWSVSFSYTFVSVNPKFRLLDRESSNTANMVKLLLLKEVRLANNRACWDPFLVITSRSCNTANKWCTYLSHNILSSRRLRQLSHWSWEK